MPDLSPRQHWDDVYGRKAENEVSWFEALPSRSLELIEQTGADRSAPIIDIGGGLSRLADALVAEGYSDVTVLDISSEAIRRLLARQKASTLVRGIVSDVTVWQPDRIYAVWHDRAVLHFLIDEADRAVYRAKLLAALAPQGHVIIATFAPSGPERCSGLPVRRYGREDLRSWLGNEFTLLDSFEFDHTTPSGAVQRFHVGRFQRH
ncbi:MAG: class I SAM-dependent methyltransferase [Terriglobia bacterium]|nr:class I SAM-dependent methyltransferase [Terriglobia bacterium]